MRTIDIGLIADSIFLFTSVGVAIYFWGVGGFGKLISTILVIAFCLKLSYWKFCEYKYKEIK